MYVEDTNILAKYQLEKNFKNLSFAKYATPFSELFVRLNNKITTIL